MLIAVTDRQLCKGDFLKTIQEIAKGGVDRIILREKDLSDNEYEQLARKVKEICDEHRVPLTIHSRAKIARKLKVDSVHLTFSAFLEHRNECTDFNSIGVSIHSLEEAKTAQRLGASYLIVGHIFETACKEGTRGILFLKEICEIVTIPVYAIGGIVNEQQVKDVLNSGCDDICVMSTLMQVDEPIKRVLEYKSWMKQDLIP